MSFAPIASIGVGKSLFGGVAAANLLEVDTSSSGLVRNTIDDSLFRKRVRSKQPQEQSLNATIKVIIITAVLFVVILSIYDVLKSYINNCYAAITLRNEDAEFTEKEIQRTLLANQEAFIATTVFCCIAILIALVVLAIAYGQIQYGKKHTKN